MGPTSRVQQVEEQRAVQRAQEEGMGDLWRGTMKGSEDRKQLVKSGHRSQQSMPMLKGKVGFHCWSFIFYACLICFVTLGMEGTKEYLGSVESPSWRWLILHFPLHIYIPPSLCPKRLTLWPAFTDVLAKWESPAGDGMEEEKWHWGVRFPGFLTAEPVWLLPLAKATLLSTLSIKSLVWG